MKQLALVNQRVVRGYVFFVQNLKDGHKAIMGRDAHGHDAEPFYFLINEARIKPRLGMEKTVRQAVEEAFPRLWEQTWKDIMAKGLIIK